jgi:aminoglycoside phosphotransferase (APT) family kinase protein
LVQVYAYVDEEMPKWHTRVTPDMARNLAEKLRRLHATPHSEIGVNPQISPSGLPNDSRARVSAVLNAEPRFGLERRALRSLNRLERLMRAQCLAHNDLHVGNVIYDGTEFWLIDLEAIGLGEPFLDLAVISHMIARCEGMEDAFLHAYFGRPPTPLENARLLIIKAVSALRYGISSFSNCERHNGLWAEPTLPVPAYLDHDEAVHGPFDLSRDDGWYRLCTALLKQGFDYLTDPAFVPAMSLLTNGAPFWDDGEFTLAGHSSPNSTFPASGPLEDGTLVALARLLRALARTREGSHRQPPASRPSVPHPLRRHHDELERLLQEHAGSVPCHAGLSPDLLRTGHHGGFTRVWIEGGADMGAGPAFLDAASIALHLDLPGEQERFLLTCLAGGAVSARAEALFEVTKQFARLRIATGLCPSARRVPEHRRAQVARQARYTLDASRYRRALELINGDTP